MTGRDSLALDAGSRSVADLILDCGVRYADRVFLRQHDAADRGESTPWVSRESTYGSVTDLSRQLAAGWMARGVPRGARIAVLMENSLELVVTEWACLLAGFVWVALNVRTSSVELKRLIDDCTPDVFVCSPRTSVLAKEIKFGRRCTVSVVSDLEPSWSELLSSGAVALEGGLTLEAPRAAEPVRIRYTSGTSGKPKGAVLARRAYDASVEAVTGVVGPISSSDVLLQVAPMTHASGAMLLPYAVAGASADILKDFDPLHVIETIERRGVTAVFLVPTMLIRLLDAIDDPRRVSTLKTIVYGGASMPVDRLELALGRLGPVFVQIYGLTESTWPVCSLSRQDHVRRPRESSDAWHARLRSVGRPTSVGQVSVVTSTGDDVGDGDVGEILVRGRNTMDGYWAPPGRARPQDSKGLNDQGWMHTGDVGFRDAEGYVTIVDRLHDMIVSGGFNVYPREVEDALSRHPAVLESAVVGKPDPEWGEIVHADVVLRAGTHTGIEDLTRHCAELLPGYKKPRSVEFVGSLPKNPSGKILRRQIRARLLD